MTEEKTEYKTKETTPPPAYIPKDYERIGREAPLLPRPMPLEPEIMRMGGKDPLNETNKLMYHGINSGLFLYGSAWTSAIMMAWFMFLGYVPSGAIQWVLIGIMILIGILNYPVKASQNPKPKEDKKDERTNK